MQDRIWRIRWLMLCSDAAVVQASVLDGLSFDPFSFQEDGLAYSRSRLRRGSLTASSRRRRSSTPSSAGRSRSWASTASCSRKRGAGWAVSSDVRNGNSVAAVPARGENGPAGQAGKARTGSRPHPVPRWPVLGRMVDLPNRHASRARDAAPWDRLTWPDAFGVRRRDVDVAELFAGS